MTNQKHYPDLGSIASSIRGKPEVASRNVGCFLRLAGEVLFCFLAIDDDLNAKAMKTFAPLRKVGNVALCPLTFRQ